MTDMREDVRCDSFEEDLSAFVDGELDAARETALRSHAEACASCADAIERLRHADGVLRALAAAPAANESVRLAALGRGLGARAASARRAPRRVRPWLAPFGAGSLAGAAAAAAALLLFATPPSAPPRDAAAADAALAEAVAAAKARVAASEVSDAFADRGASAPAETPATAPATDAPIAHPDLVARLAELSPEERAALERDVARWQALPAAERDRLRAR